MEGWIRNFNICWRRLALGLATLENYYTKRNFKQMTSKYLILISITVKVCIEFDLYGSYDCDLANKLAIHITLTMEWQLLRPCFYMIWSAHYCWDFFLKEQLLLVGFASMYSLLSIFLALFWDERSATVFRSHCRCVVKSFVGMTVLWK